MKNYKVIYEGRIVTVIERIDEYTAICRWTEKGKIIEAVVSVCELDMIKANQSSCEDVKECQI